MSVVLTTDNDIILSVVVFRKSSSSDTNESFLGVYNNLYGFSCDDDMSQPDNEFLALISLTLFTWFGHVISCIIYLSLFILQ